MKVIYVQNDGVERDVEVEAGTSVMRGALDHGIPGIVADCGGACGCATCHVFVDAPWTALTGEPDEIEEAMLDLVDERAPNSRLSCQIVMAPALDGLKVFIPDHQ